jgi:hypothetical protein
MFFKRAYKKIWNNFHNTEMLKKEVKTGIKNLRKPEKFYQHYFEQISKQKDIQLNNFYHPDKKYKKIRIKKYQFYIF